ncbi:MAG: 5-(carboxyamino)imidazole ribonucleotide mutase [Bacillota bacterium]
MKVAIVMGSKSDYPIVEETEKILDKFGIKYDTRVISAHRTPEIAFDFAKNAYKNGYGVIIGVAGKAAHLAGVLAGISILPVIGLPIKSSNMDGLDSLLSTVQMPPGVPVATVAINGAVNAGILATQILAVKHDDLKVKLLDYKEEMKRSVIQQDSEVQK